MVSAQFSLVREITTLVKWIRSFIFQRLELVNYGQKNSDCFQGLIFSLQTPTFSLPIKSKLRLFLQLHLSGYFFIHVWKEKSDCMFSNFQIQPIINDFNKTFSLLSTFRWFYVGIFKKSLIDGRWKWEPMKIFFKIWFHNCYSAFFKRLIGETKDLL